MNQWRLRRRCGRRRLIGPLLFLVVSLQVFSQGQVSLEALMPGMVVITVDGERHTLRKGASVAGVTLIDTTPREAVLNIGGVERRMGVSDRVSGVFSTPTARRVEIPRNDRLQYETLATINGRGISVLIDTGANIVAMNSRQAERLGIPGSAGIATQVETAGNTLTGRSVQLDSVDVGGIRVNNVQATVLEGDYPRMVLLGMTFLRHVNLEERNGVLSLSREW